MCPVKQVTIIISVEVNVACVSNEGRYKCEMQEVEDIEEAFISGLVDQTLKN